MKGNLLRLWGKEVIVAAALAATVMLLFLNASWRLADGEVYGKVVLPKGYSIPDASVYLLDPFGKILKEVATNADGRFRFENVKAGRYIVSVTKLSYSTASQMLEFGGEIESLSLVLRQSAVARLADRRDD